MQLGGKFRVLLFSLLTSLFSFSALGYDRCLVFDLDETLVTVLPSYPASRLRKNVFKKHNEIVRVDFSQNPNDYHEYVVYPGTKEILRYAAVLNDYKIKFFSMGGTVRNQLLVKILLNKTFGKKVTSELIAKGFFEIYSRESAKEVNKDDPTQQPKFKSNLPLAGSHKKDLLTANCDPLTSILIDDNSTNMPRGQEGNLLYVPNTLDIDEYLRNPGEFIGPIQDNRKFSHLYYVAGLLEASIVQSREFNLPLPQIINNLQYELKNESFNFPGPNEKTYRNRGREILSKYIF